MGRTSKHQYTWFHDRLVDAYCRSGLTVSQLSQKTGISKSQIYRMLFELQWPSIPDMLRLEDAMQLDRGYLISRPKGDQPR